MTTPSTLERLRSIRPSESDQTSEVLTESQRSEMLHRIISSPQEDTQPLRSTTGQSKRVALVASAAALIVAGGVGFGINITRGNGPSHASALAGGKVIRARLLSALDSTNDIIETTTTWAAGGIHDDWTNASGTINHDIQTGWPETLMTVTSSGRTLTAVYPETKTWMTESNTNTEPISGLTVPDILRTRVQSGTLTVLATNVTINGQDTTEVLLTDPPEPASADSDLWVSTATGLPIREATPGTTDGVTNWNYYAADSGEASHLSMTVPDGFTEVSPPASADVPPGGKIPIMIWNGTAKVKGYATCPSGGSSCLTYPRTLPLPTSGGSLSGNSGVPTGSTSATIPSSAPAGNSGVSTSS